MITACALLFLPLVSVSNAQMWTARKETPADAVTPPPTSEPDLLLFPNGGPVHLNATPPGLASATAQSCNGCHFAIHDNWATSAHARSSHNASFNDAVHRAGNSTACSQCHRPLVEQHAQLAAGYIDGDLSRPVLKPNPAFDATFLAEGVGCAACHVRDGAIVSTRSIENAPHPVVASQELGKSSFCAHCHQLTFPGSDQPFYNTYGEWKSTPYARNGVRCHDCHMPPKAGAATATRFAASPDHAMTADLSRALTILVKIDNPTIQRGTPENVVFTVQNTGAGHHVPTGNPHKKLTIKARLVGKDGSAIADVHSEELGRTVNAAPPYETSADNRIPAGGQHTFSATFSVPHNAKAGPIQLQVTGTTGGFDTALLSVPLELR